MKDNLDILDILSIAAFIIGVYSYTIAVQNLNENRIQTEDTKQILNKLNEHLRAQDKHLAEQDKHLAEQDKLLLKGVNNENSNVY